MPLPMGLQEGGMTGTDPRLLALPGSPKMCVLGVSGDYEST